MKLLLLLALLVSLGAALETLQARQTPRRRRPVTRPSPARGEMNLVPPQPPVNVPSGYRIGMAQPSRRRARAGLTKLPPQFIDDGTSHRRRREALARLENRQQPQDFYECEKANPAPTSADCNVIINQVQASNEDIMIPANACVIFDYGTCRGFFCSLCGNLRASTNFIGNQLITADTLCVSAGGQVGTVVGTQAPQWDAGFVLAGGSLPTYDVC